MRTCANYYFECGISFDRARVLNTKKTQNSISTKFPKRNQHNHFRNNPADNLVKLDN